MGRHQEGNIAWKASLVAQRYTKGNLGKPHCRAKKPDGSPCLNLPVTGFPFCYVHGGRMVIAKRKLHRRKLRYAAWTKDRRSAG